MSAISETFGFCLGRIPHPEQVLGCTGMCLTPTTPRAAFLILTKPEIPQRVGCPFLSGGEAVAHTLPALAVP